jgi:WD40 repeat protein
MQDHPGESGSSELGVLASSSSSSGRSADIQRAVIARRVFGAAPSTIGRFEILEVLGAGASGVVYGARDPLLHRRVAIKVLVRPGGNVAETDGWLREARALAQLSHRNVVTIYEVGDWSGYSFLAMELIEGVTLARWLTAEHRTLAEISAAFVDAGRGLAAAHARDRVHRDFKPANVLVANDGRVVVTDFGLVDDPGQHDVRAAASHRPVGTPAYAAPEQRRGAAPAPSADVYSFAVALAEAVLGSHPKPESSTRWKPLLRRRVSRRLYRELCAAMVVDPRQRTASLAPLLAALSSSRVNRSQRRLLYPAVAAAAAFVLGVASWTGGRGVSGLLHRMPVPEGPAALFEAAAELQTTPLERRDERWAERARALLLQPVPMRVPCAWPEPPLRVDFEADTAVMQDRQGRHLRCEIRTGRLEFAGAGASRVDAPHWVPDRAPVDRVAWQIDDRVLRWRRGLADWHTRTIPADTRDGVLAPGEDRVLLWRPGGRLDVYELASGRRYPLAEARIQTAAFLRGGDVVAADDTGTVWRWSTAQLRSWVLADHAGEGTMWAFAACEPGGEIVSATHRKDDAILVSSPSGAPQRTLVKPEEAEIFALSCRGDQILAGTRDGRVLQWQWPTGLALGEHDLDVPAWIWAIATTESPGGLRVNFLGTGPIRPGLIGGRVIALRDGTMSSLYEADPSGSTGIGELAVSSDGGRVAVATSSEMLALIDVAAGDVVAPVRAHRGEVRRVRFTDADRSLVTAGDDGYLRRWRASGLAMQSQVDVRHGQIFDLDVRGNIALVATSDGHVGAWDLDGQRLVRSYAGHSMAVVTSRFDRSGVWLANGDVAGFACVHRANRDRCHVELRGHRPGSAVRHVRFVADGQLITASDDGTVRQWNLLGDASTARLAAELQVRSGGTP